MENSTLDMDYVSGANNIKTTYNYTGTIGQANLGVRILDPNVGLMSFLNISYVSAIGETIDAKVNVGGSEGVLDVVDVSKSNIHASLGFGFIF